MSVGPVYKELLIVAIVAYIISNVWIQYQLIQKVGDLDHQIFHLSQGKLGSEKENENH